MSRGWPRMPIGRSSDVTARRPRYLLIAWCRDPSRSAPDAQWREAAVRLAVTTAAVALGVGMLLVVLAGMNAINAQNARTAWLNSGPLLGIVNAPGSPRGSHSTSSAKPLWWLLRTDYFGSQTIYQVDVAATGPGSPVPPGIPRLPGPGQFYASPALSRLLRSTPANELAARFPGHQIGTIGPSALPSPSSLVIVVG